MAQQPVSVAAQHPLGAALDAALDAAADAQVAVNAAAGRRTVALARVLAAGTADEGVMLDLGVEWVSSATPERRGSVAHRALVAEVACALGVSEHVAQGWLADAGVLAAKAPATVEALCAGSISYRHAEKLADAVADLPAAAAAQVEQAVLGRAATMTAARFGALARAARDRLHPVPAQVRREAAAARADVWVDDGRDGMSWLTAHLPTPVARAVHDRLTRTATRAKTSGDLRGVGQLRAATLTALLLDDARSTPVEPDETTTGCRPAQPSTTSVEPVETTTGCRPAQPPSPPDPLSTLARNIRPVLHVTVPVTTLTGDGESSGLLDGTTPIDPETARHLAARAPTLRRILTDPVTGAMLTVDRRSYVVPADLRAFLTQRDVTCRFPGCQVPARRCDLDHTIAWAHGGATDATNLASLCRKHHTIKHESRWHVEQLDHGVLAWTSPRGRTYLTTPGTADHTLTQLDAWNHEAAHVISQAHPSITAAPDAHDDGARPAAHPRADRDDGDDPPF
ncbi:DUF222 domain-containing protein [Isoptericola sp. F-RaC21]|uniref:HNH endonuclease signature motif containing protein n=1 Tax=Isoptericola sp. F-RaC21 TaxID=3141452 RepID=UPI00315BFFF3